MSEIYKINRVINNQISQIYVFVGHQDKTVEEIKGDGSTFSATELRNIDKNNIFSKPEEEQLMISQVNNPKLK